MQCTSAIKSKFGYSAIVLKLCFLRCKTINFGQGDHFDQLKFLTKNLQFLIWKRTIWIQKLSSRIVPSFWMKTYMDEKWNSTEHRRNYFIRYNVSSGNYTTFHRFQFLFAFFSLNKCNLCFGEFFSCFLELSVQRFICFPLKNQNFDMFFIITFFTSWRLLCSSLYIFDADLANFRSDSVGLKSSKASREKLSATSRKLLYISTLKLAW